MAAGIRWRLVSRTPHKRQEKGGKFVCQNLVTEGIVYLFVVFRSIIVEEASVLLM